MDMIQINLLPKEFRKKSVSLSFGKTAYYVIGAFAGVVVMIAVITFYQMYQVRELEKKIEIADFRTKQLEKDIQVVDALIDVKEKLTKRLEAVDRLDQHRTVWVRILEDVSHRVPDFMWLSMINEGLPPAPQVAPGDTTTRVQDPTAALQRDVDIEGYAFTLNSLANFMIKLMRSNFFTEIEMAEVEEVEFEKQKAYKYRLTATLHYLSDQELKEILANESGPQVLAGF